MSKSNSVGTKLLAGTGTGAVEVGGLKTINGIEITAETIDVTSLDNSSGYREKLPGFKEVGDVTLSGFLDGADAGQTQMYTLLNSQASSSFEIRFPTAIGKSWTFTGSVAGFTTSVDVGDAIKVCHHGVCINGLDAGHNAPESVPKVQHHSSGGQRGDIEQQQLDDTSGTGTADTAKKYKKHDEHRTDYGRPREGDTEKTGDHCRGGKHLRHNADKYADKEEYGTHCFGTPAILAGHNFEQRGATAVAKWAGIYKCQHQCSQCGPNGEPPSRDAETESQLSGAYGGLSTHQGTENGATHHPRARATARSETLGVFHLATGKNTDGQK